MRIFWFVLFIAGCGYHFQEGDSAYHASRTINVPYVKGDVGGLLTNAIIKELAHSGFYRYVDGGGALTLHVEIVGDISNKIGYRYDRKNACCERINNLQPTEARREVTVELSLVEEGSLLEVVKPTLVTGSSEYDFVGTHSLCDLSFIKDGRRVTVESYSLGQLDSVEGAQDDALIPLYRNLAQKIVEGLHHL